MIPERQEYLTFLATAIERLTVSNFDNWCRSVTGAGRQPATKISFVRKLLAKIHLEPLPMPYRPQSYAM